MVVQNKKGSIPTVTLVILTLVLTISSLLIFYLNGTKASQNIAESRIIEGVYVHEDLAKYYVYVVGTDLISNNSLSKESFIKEFSKIKFEDEYLLALQKIISTGKFSIDENNFELDEKSFASYYFDQNMKITYLSSLHVSLDKTKEQEYFLNIGEDSSSGILAFDWDGNFKAMSDQECVSGLAQRKIDLAIPDKLCYWEAKTQVYKDKCPNLKEADIAEIFQKKAEYRQLNNPDWSSLSTDGDFCVPVIYDCDKWSKPEGYNGAVVMSKSWGGYYNPMMKNIQINPFLSPPSISKVFVQKDMLLHEGLHSIQSSEGFGYYVANVDLDFFSGNITSILKKNAKQGDEIGPAVELISNRVHTFEEKLNNESSSIYVDSYQKTGKFDVLSAEDTERLAQISKTREELWNFSFDLDTPKYQVMNPSVLSDFYEKNVKNLLIKDGLFDVEVEKAYNSIISINEDSYQSYRTYLNDKVKYLGSKVEVDPRLSQVQAWWLDKTAPNCEIIYTREDAKRVLDQFLVEENLSGEYWVSQQSFKFLLDAYSGTPYENQVYEDLVGRLPGLAYDPVNDGTLPA